MAKAKSNTRKIRAAVAQPTQAQQPEQTAGAVAIREVFITTGGTVDKPVRENIALIPAVTPDQLTSYGVSKASVLRGLACNILAGVALDRGFMDKEGDVWSNRSLRTEKTAFFWIMESGLTVQQLRDAWQQSLAQRKRYDAPTIQALNKVARAYKVNAGDLPKRVSPMERFARDLLKIANDAKLSEVERLRSMVYHLNQKANAEAGTAPVQKAA